MKKVRPSKLYLQSPKSLHLEWPSIDNDLSSEILDCLMSFIRRSMERSREVCVVGLSNISPYLDAYGLLLVDRNIKPSIVTKPLLVHCYVNKIPAGSVGGLMQALESIFSNPRPNAIGILKSGCVSERLLANRFVDEMAEILPNLQLPESLGKYESHEIIEGYKRSTDSV
ncbi:hypothetical protein ACOME3_006651 [Neoechinorhynchus agilis]